MDKTICEIARAWWVPFESVPAELARRQAAWEEGSGSRVETWTEILIREFWSDYLASR